MLVPIRCVLRRVVLVLLAVLLAIAAGPALASVETGVRGDAGACGPSAACPLDEDVSASSPAPPEAAAARVQLVFFWGIGCPHCEEAKPFLDALVKEEPRLSVESVEVRRDPEGRRRFLETMKRLGATTIGVPTFVVGDSYVVGYLRGETDREVREMVTRALRPAGPGAPTDGRADEIAIPVVGIVDPRTASLPALTVGIGLVDGINPCAIWVLVVLLGILLHVKTTTRMLLYAAGFVVMSGLVYFMFMAAWSTFFALAGLSRIVTAILGGALLVMGAINLKDTIWFKKGPSLVIPDRVKPTLFRRMRGIAQAATVPAAFGGILVLAFMVNLVELGCTIGLPAVYTRILSVRGLGTVARFGYLALYNVAYVVPLMAVVVAFITVRRRVTVTERAARVLKGVSGVLLTCFGALFLAAPEALLG